MTESESAIFSDDGNQRIIKSTVFVGQQRFGSFTSANGPVQEENETDGSGGYSLMFDDIFVYNQEPIKDGSRVFKGYQKHATGQKTPIAIKMIAPFKKKNLREVDHLMTLAPHPNVVQIIRSKKCEGRACPELYIIMELCKSETLKDYSEKTPFDFDEIMSFCKQLIKGIKHIHDNNIVHGDLKPENILFSLDGESVRVTDFGISKQLRKGKSKTKFTSHGTDSYRAPETFNSEVISQKADIYSLGIVLFGAFTNGSHPFGKDERLQTYNMTENTGRDFSALPAQMPESKKSQFCNLLDKMLQTDPSKRPTINAVLRSEFFSSASKDEDQPVLNNQRMCLSTRGVLIAIMVAVLSAGFMAEMRGLTGNDTQKTTSEIKAPLDTTSSQFPNPSESGQGTTSNDGLATAHLDLVLMEKYVAGTIVIKIVSTSGKSEVNAFSKLDQGVAILFRSRSATPYQKPRTFNINGNIKAVTDLKMWIPGLGKVETRDSSPGLVIWFDTEKRQYVVVNLGGEAMKLKSSISYDLPKGVPVAVHSLDDFLKMILSADTLEHVPLQLPLFQIFVQYSFGDVSLDMYVS